MRNSGMAKTDAVKLVVEYDMLHTPFEAIVDELNRTHFRECGMTDPFKAEGERGPSHPVCLFTHPGGDHDTIPWPMTKPEHRAWLAGSLFDARETGLIPDVSEVVLPDGSVFNF